MFANPDAVLLEMAKLEQSKNKKRTEIPVVFQVTREQCAGFFSLISLLSFR